MKDFFKTDEAMVDLIIVGVIFLLIYISQNITPITIGTVVSGEAENNLFSFFGAQVNLGDFGVLFLSLKNALGVLAVVLLAGVFFVAIRTDEITKKEREKYAPVKADEGETKALVVKWQVILGHVNSESPAEWKLAILEADNILDEILDSEGYQGETLGEKLKSMPPGAIHSYNDLWEAHKMRNLIAHEAGDMELNKKTARDTINKFEVAFRELGHI
jgi:hypothetical protein